MHPDQLEQGTLQLVCLLVSSPEDLAHSAHYLPQYLRGTSEKIINDNQPDKSTFSETLTLYTSFCLGKHNQSNQLQRVNKITAEENGLFLPKITMWLIQ